MMVTLNPQVPEIVSMVKNGKSRKKEIGVLPFRQEHVHHKDVVVYFLPVVVDGPLSAMIDPGLSHHNDVVHLRYKSTTRSWWKCDVEASRVFIPSRSESLYLS